jgi:superfamily II DNA or RNA helicase
MSKGYLSKHGCVIKKSELSIEELNELKNTLTARPLVDDKFGATSTTINYPVYLETINKIYIPKMFALKKFGVLKETSSYLGKEFDRVLQFKGDLYDYQKKPVELLLQACKERGGGILSLLTGFGKTISTIYVLSKLGGKTLIVVNKIPLMNQWISEIARFLPDAKVGKIQGQSNIKIHDCDIVVGMLQSLSKIDYPDELFSDFRVCVFDEVHNVSSRCFSKVLFKVTSKYSIGLSATPNRSDGCEYIFKWHLGDIVYQNHTKTREGKPPIIHLLKLKSTEYKLVTSEQLRYGKPQIQFTSMISELIEMKPRNELIINIIKQLLEPKSELSVDPNKRKILLLSDRRSHVQLLKKMLDDSDTPIPFTYDLFIGNMKSEQLERSKKCDCIFATYSAFSEGVSEKDLDTLILVTPKKFIGHLQNSIKNESGRLEQIVGRIFRKTHDTHNPLIIDLCDNFSIYSVQSRTRKVFYKEHFGDTGIFKESVIDLDLNNTLPPTDSIGKGTTELLFEEKDNGYCLI